MGLITVNYEAGPMGYSAVTEKQKGFVNIRQQSSGSSSGSSSASGFSGATSGGFSTTSTTSSSSSSSVDQSDLIARIIASLQLQHRPRARDEQSGYWEVWSSQGPGRNIR